MLTSQQLYQQTFNKTVVLLQHNQKGNAIAELLLRIFDYWDKPVDFYLENSGKSSFSSNGDFIIIQSEQVAELALNIVLICEMPNDYSVAGELLENITDGGMLVFNEDDNNLKDAVDKYKKPVKKYPYNQLVIPETSKKIFLETDEGNLPITINDAFVVRCLIGIKWICQHMGIDEAEFYEAVAAV
ncbi:MAG: hypothetical protein CSA39_06360 [Flavobacteriales bacterium]|nr:MAG: hypothetical protein CSA39_06360 [Flavobacteriales bacterium]